MGRKDEVKIQSSLITSWVGSPQMGERRPQSFSYRSQRSAPHTGLLGQGPHTRTGAPGVSDCEGVSRASFQESPRAEEHRLYSERAHTGYRKARGPWGRSRNLVGTSPDLQESPREAGGNAASHREGRRHGQSFWEGLFCQADTVLAAPLWNLPSSFSFRTSPAHQTSCTCLRLGCLKPSS